MRAKTYGPYSGMARFARDWFKYYSTELAPALKGAPSLPLLLQDRFWIKSMKKGPLGYITACYADSLEAHCYDPFAHPMPEEYARGVMVVAPCLQKSATIPR
jgi:hypothetical protein